MKIRVAKLHEDAIIPTRKHSNDAGMDLYYYGEDFNLGPGKIVILNTGVSVEIPKDYFGFIADKSRNMYSIIGRIVDESYQGEILVKVVNTTTEILGFNYGQPLAQLIIIPCEMGVVEEVELADLFTDKSERGTTGGIVTQHE